MADMMIKPNDNADEINCPEATHVSSAHFPNGSGGKAICHLGQLAKSGEFRRWDFGSEKNLEKYGTEEAPIIDVSKI